MFHSQTIATIGEHDLQQPDVCHEAPLPDGWPAMTPIGIAEIRYYPAVRLAVTGSSTSRSSQFMTLFDHIRDRDIPITAPVVLLYPAETLDRPQQLHAVDSMAFIYPSTDRDESADNDEIRTIADENCDDGSDVQVMRQEPLTVVSVGVRGRYSDRHFRAALAKILAYLDSHPEWTIDGSPRVLAYNSPYIRWWKKFSEVQVPVIPCGL